MADAKHGMKNIGLLSGGNGRATNAPTQYRDRKRQYFAEATARFVEEMAPYATDFVTARMQGLVPGDFYRWSTKRIRFSDTTKQGVSLTRKTDDQKAFLVADAGVDYIPEGAKVETMGSYWLVTNPSNLSSATGNGIMRRCNAMWRFLDWYGNIREEPILVEQSLAQATANDFQEITLIMQGYFNIICQRNANTEQLDQNSRLILGRRAYQITGYSDVTQEFTGDDESTHLLYFNARMQEPNHEIDDLEAKVAEELLLGGICCRKPSHDGGGYCSVYSPVSAVRGGCGEHGGTPHRLCMVFQRSKRGHGGQQRRGNSGR